MGRDKALLELDGRPLVEHVARRCAAAGADPIRLIGGDATALGAVGHAVVADLHPGEGPLGGLCTALHGLAQDALEFVVAVDLPDLEPEVIKATADALRASPGADVAVPVQADGRPQPLHAMWRGRAADCVAATFASGARSVRAALDAVVVVAVPGFADGAFADLDTPDDLRRWHAIRDTDR